MIIYNHMRRGVVVLVIGVGKNEVFSWPVSLYNAARINQQ